MSTLLLIALLPFVLIALALHGVYEAKHTIKEQQKEISSLSDRIDRLASKLSALEKTETGNRHVDISASTIDGEYAEKSSDESQPPVYIPPTNAATTSPEQTPPAHVYQSEERPGKRERGRGGLESIIGENILSKTGILILVIGLGFFVKYAIDNDWITETGRTVMGILAGFILWGIAFRIRNAYRNFSSVLAGGGFAVEFVTVGLAYNYYSLFPSWVAFTILITITAVMTLASLRLDRMELALIATAGGFVAPFLTGSSDGSFITLCSYMLILDMGMAVVAIRRNWHVISMTCIAITYPILLIAHFSSITNSESVGALFACAYFLIFYAVMAFSTWRCIRGAFPSGWLPVFTAVNDIAFFCTAYFLFAEDKTLTAYRSLVPFVVSAFSLAVLAIYLKNSKISELRQATSNGIKRTVNSCLMLYGWAGILFFLAGCAVCLYQYCKGDISYMAFTGITILTLTAVLPTNLSGIYIRCLFPGICALLYLIQTVFHGQGIDSLIFAGVNLAFFALLLVIFLRDNKRGACAGKKSEKSSIVYLNICLSLTLPAAAYLILDGTGASRWWNTCFSLTVAAVATLQMIAGMRMHIKNLRILALASYAVVVVKLLLNDVWTMPPVSRICVFILLGVLLLAVSFLYQKLKETVFKADGENSDRDRIPRQDEC